MRSVAVFLLAWGGVVLLGKGLHLGSGWPAWMVGAIVALAVEAIVFLYRYEKGAVELRRGRWLHRIDPDTI